VSTGVEIITPIGTFEFGPFASANLFPEKRMLIVRYNGRDTAYELEEGKEYEVTFDEALYEEVTFRQEAGGDILLELRSVGVADSSPREPSPSSGGHSRLLDDFEHYGSDTALAQAHQVNAAWGKNVGHVRLASPPNVKTGKQGLAFDYEIRSAPPDDYAGFERSFPAQDWRNYGSLQIWVKSDRSNRDLVVQFRETSGEVWRYRTNLSAFTTKIFQLPLNQGTFQWADWSTNQNRRMDLDAIDAYGFFIGNGGQGAGTVYVDDIALK
jgi:hypothetical protein